MTPSEHNEDDRMDRALAMASWWLAVVGLAFAAIGMAMEVWRG